MKWLKRLLCLTMLLAMICSLAQAEVSLLPQVSAWQLEKQPLSVTLTANVNAWMPLDDTRTGWLNDLLKHMTLKLGYQQLEGESWSSVDVLVDGTSALTMKQRDGDSESQLLLSAVSGKNYVAATGTDIAGLVLGDSTEVAFAGVDGTELAWLTDAYDLACGLDVALKDYAEEKTIKTAIGKMGTARKKVTYTVPKESAETLAASLSGLCVAGEMQTLISSLVFSGKQQFTAYYTEDGALIKVSYSGECGVDEEHLRKVTLNWSMKRTETEVRDDFTMKSPAVTGKDHNTITFTRLTKEKTDGSVTLESTLKMDTKLDGVKNVLTIDADLKAESEDDGTTMLTGTLSIKNAPEEDEDKTQLVLTPTLSFADASATDRYVDGAVTVEKKAGENLKRVEQSGTIHISVNRGSYFDWELNDTVVDLSAMDETQLTAVQTEVQSAVATALVRPLVLLPAEDTNYLSADLDEAVWQSIVDAAKAAMEKEAAQ